MTTSHLLAAASSGTKFVDLDIQPWHWGMLLGSIVVLLAVDLFRHRHNHEPNTKTAVGESLLWVMCGAIFAMLIAAVVFSERRTRRELAAKY
jgi:drug/metabolite transporter (DMT)-like permease